MKGLGTQKQLWVLGWHKSYAGHIILGLMPTFYENHLSLLFSFLFLHLFYVFFMYWLFMCFFHVSSRQLGSACTSLRQLASADQLIIDSCASSSDTLISLSYLMPAFSANSFGLFCTGVSSIFSYFGHLCWHFIVLQCLWKNIKKNMRKIVHTHSYS